MSNKIVIIKNLTASGTYIDDLGVYVPPSGQVNVTELFESKRYSLANSLDLANLVNTDALIVNNGTQDLLKTEVASYLEQFSILTHDLFLTHTGELPESKIVPEGEKVFVRVDAPLTINTAWTFDSTAGGKLLIENGATLPVGTIENGRVFWRTTDNTLHIGSNGVWNNTKTTKSTVIYEFGSYSTIGSSGAYVNSQWSVSTTAPAIMARSGKIMNIAISANLSSGTVTGFRVVIRRLVGTTWTDIIVSEKTDGVGCKLDNDLNINVSKHDQLACFVQSFGTNTPVIVNAHCYIEVMWDE